MFVLSLIGIIPVINYRRYQKNYNQRIIKLYGYKIFKFIINQVSSGIKIGDAIQGLHHIVMEPKLKETLIHMAAIYHQTNEINLALDTLRKSYDGEEVESLCTALQQGLQSGTQAEMLEKMESMLFKKYLFFIKYETQLRKRRSVLAVLAYCIVIVLMISIPMVLDMFDALDEIFI